MNPTGQLYSDNNDFQKKWAADILSSIEFRQNGYRNVLDIGCGSGEVTNTILNEINYVENFVAFDKNESMVEFARLKYPNPKIEYLVADVTKPDSFRPEWRHKFDLITSFLALNWTPSQYSNLENMKSLLSPNGEMILLISTSAESIVSMFELVTKLEKWAPYFQEFHPEWIEQPGFDEYSEWRYPDEVVGYRRMAKSLGFSVKDCMISSIDYIFPDLQAAKRGFRVIIPHTERIAETEISEFIDDAFDVYMERFPLGVDGKFHFNVNAILVHLRNDLNA